MAARFFQGLGLLLGALRQVLVAHGDFGRGPGDRMGAAAHLLDQRGQLVAHHADFIQQAGAVTRLVSTGVESSPCAMRPAISTA
jgi:hypothetical protein